MNLNKSIWLAFSRAFITINYFGKKTFLVTPEDDNEVDSIMTEVYHKPDFREEVSLS